jgi:4-hydroxy-tetrahydrodipicolinate synthase
MAPNLPLGRPTRSPLKGVFSVAPTPFRPDGTIELDDLAPVIGLLLGAQVDGLVALGVTSETSRLSDSERIAVLERVFLEVDGRVPVVVGTTTDGLVTCIELSRRAAALGAAAVMVGPPRGSRMGAGAVLRYFTALHDATGAAIVLQDYPAVSGFAMEPSLLAKLARELPLAAIKLEDPPTPPKIAAVLAAAGDAGVPIFGGLGGAFLFEELLGGASGAMTGFAYPEVLVHVTRAFHEGRVGEAAAIFYRYAPVLRFEAQEGLGMAIRKEFLRRRGAISHADLRRPGAAIDPATRSAIDWILDWSGLRDPNSKDHPWN